MLLPILILASLFALFMRLSQQADASGMGGFSRWRGQRSKLGPGNQDGPSFADVAGAPGAVAELQELCDLLRNPARYRALGARPPKGALLVGPPGTGKTLLARATAGEAHAAFFSVSGAEFVESLVGVGAARIRDLFTKARAAAPAIVFIDELDAVGRKRGAGVGQGNDEREQTLNQLLVEMDGFDAGGGLIVLAATNRPDILDPALLRPGRFDRQVTVDAPDAAGRAEILALYLEGRPCAEDVDPEAIARRCPGFTGAELENVVNEAALLSARSGHTSIGLPDLDEAIQRVVGGPRNETHVLGPDELETIGVHEAAHAVVAAANGDGAQVHQLSIVSRGRRLGRATTLLLDRDRTVLRRSDLERQLAVAMAGAAAERHGVRRGLHRGQRRPAHGDAARPLDGHVVRDVRARPGDDRRAQRGGLPRRVAAGARLRRAGHARAHRRRDARDRRGRRGARDGDAERQLGRRAGDRARPRGVRDARRRPAREPSRRRPRRAAQQRQRRAAGALNHRRLAIAAVAAAVTAGAALAFAQSDGAPVVRPAVVDPPGGPRRRRGRSSVRDRADAPPGRARGRSAATATRRSCCSAPRAAAGRRRRCRRPAGRWAATAPQHAGEMTADGHGAVLLADPEHPEQPATLFTRAPGAAFAAAPDPGAALAADEQLVSDATAATARTLLAVSGADTFVAPTTADGTGRAVLRLDADGWHREAIVARPTPSTPSGSPPPGRAWMLATSGDQVVLLRRDPDTRDLGAGEPRRRPRSAASRRWRSPRRPPTRSPPRPTGSGSTCASRPPGRARPSTSPSI